MVPQVEGSQGDPTNSEAPSQAAINQLQKTKLIFHFADQQEAHTHQTCITSLSSLSSLDPADQSLFKTPQDSTDSVFAITTESTIFHPQGGGQPSDGGHFLDHDSDNTSEGRKIFEVLSARVSVSQPSIVLHFGTFTDPSSTSLPSGTIIQVVDAQKRKLYSRLHTAGHVLGAATRTLLESRIENFDELKASHFPDSASCEFQGLIDGKYKPEIQGAVDELVAKDAEVSIEWWTKAQFKERGLERLIPSTEMWKEIATYVDGAGQEVEGVEGEHVGDEKTRIRVVNIVGAEVYPCGGTHVPTTKGCGKVTVRKISRQKGNSKVSYLVD